MDALIRELNRRLELATDHLGMEFLPCTCDYMDLLVLHQDTQEVLRKQEQEKDSGNPQNIWKFYRQLYTLIYEPIRIQHVDLEKHYKHFTWLDDEDREASPLYWIFLFVWPPSAKALWHRYKYRRFLDLVHDQMLILLKNKELLTPAAKPIKRLEFNNEKGVLYLNQYEIPINRKGVITDQHRILSYIFKHTNLRQEFFYAEMAEEVYGEEYDSSPRKYWDNCNSINDKVAEATKGTYPPLLIPTLEKRGLVKINPDCWELFR